MRKSHSMLRFVFAALIAGAAASTALGQVPGTCSPPGTATCDPDGNPIPGPVVPGPVAPDPGTPDTGDPGDGGGAPEPVTVVHSLTAVVPLGGGRPVKGAEGIALDATTGLAYIGLNGNIVSGCEGDASLGGVPLPGSAGSNQMSIVNPSLSIEVAAVPTGQAPIWPTLDPNRGVVYMMGSGGAGTVTVHDPIDGRTLGTIVVGGKPHMGGLDHTTGLMVVGNTVRASDIIAEQNYASVIDTATDTVALAFETSPAPHGIVVDQERDLMYFSAVGDGAIVVVHAATGQVLFSGIPKAAYGADFGGNNMLARQAATRRLFQVNTQLGHTGILVADEITLAAEKVIALENNAIPWGMAVDEPNRLLFAALPNTNVVGVVDLDTLTHVASIPVGTCPYAVAVDPARRLAVVTNQGSPTEDATASILSLCPIYAATGRAVAGCSVLDQLRFSR
jgi:DNA-binding beta-propeller fold protein YncE